MLRQLSSACVVALGLTAVAAPAFAVTELIQNGDFETIDGRLGLTVGDSGGQALNALFGTGNGSWDVYEELPGGWFTSGGEGIEVQTNGTVGTVDANSGKHYIELDSEQDDGTSNSSMSQNVNGLTVGAKYRFSFHYSPRTSNINDNQISWLIAPQVVGALPIVDGVASGPLAANGTAVGKWTMFEALFTATDEDVVVSFTAGGADNELGGFIDDVSLQVIPAPAGVLLIFSAFGGAAALRRFSRA